MVSELISMAQADTTARCTANLLMRSRLLFGYSQGRSSSEWIGLRITCTRWTSWRPKRGREGGAQLTDKATRLGQAEQSCSSRAICILGTSVHFEYLFLVPIDCSICAEIMVHRAPMFAARGATRRMGETRDGRWRCQISMRKNGK